MLLNWYAKPFSTLVTTQPPPPHIINISQVTFAASGSNSRTSDNNFTSIIFPYYMYFPDRSMLWNEKQARISCITAGATSYMTKPFKRRVIIMKLADCLKPKEVLWMQAGWLKHINSVQERSSENGVDKSSQRILDTSLQQSSTRTTPAVPSVPKSPASSFQERSSANGVDQSSRRTLDTSLQQSATRPTAVVPIMPETPDSPISDVSHHIPPPALYRLSRAF